MQPQDLLPSGIVSFVAGFLVASLLFCLAAGTSLWRRIKREQREFDRAWRESRERTEQRRHARRGLSAFKVEGVRHFAGDGRQDPAHDAHRSGT